MRIKWILLFIAFILVIITEATAQTSEKVGINISNPENTLHMKVDDTSPVGIQYTNLSTTDVSSFRNNTSNTGISINSTSAGPWVGPSNAASSIGGSYFEGESESTQPSDILQVTFQFTNAIPLDATLTGFQASVTRLAVNSSGITDETIQLVRGSTIQGVNKATTNNWPSTNWSQATYGGQNDLWGASTFSPSQINSGLLGLRIQFDSPIFSSPSARVDFVSMRVYYTIPGTATMHWVSGSVDGVFKINASNDLTQSSPFVIHENGDTELQQLLIPGNASTGRVLTSDANGLASWQSLPNDMVDDADADPNNEIQDLVLNGNSLEISGGNNVDLTPFLDNSDDWNNGNGIIFHDSGKVGVGNNAPVYQLDVEDISDNDVVSRIINTSNDSNSSGMAIGVGPHAAPTETNQYIKFLSGDGSLIGSISGNTSGNISYNTTSDRRLKKNIHPYNEGLDAVTQIEPVLYEMIDTPGKEQIGFIAQDLYKILPSSVIGTPDTPVEKPMMVDYSKITPVLVSAIKEQQKTIEKLTEAHMSLVSEMNKLKEFIHQLDINRK